MGRSPKRTPGRTALVLMFFALVAIVCVAVYAFLVGRLDPESPGEITGQHLRAELSILLAAILLILIFVVGSYLLIRIGRSVAQKRVGGKPTEYVDAWSRYRLTEEEIEAATREQPPEGQGPDQPDDDSAPPHGDPEDPDSES